MNGNWDGTDPGHVASGVGAAMDNGQFVSDFSKSVPGIMKPLTESTLCSSTANCAS